MSFLVPLGLAALLVVPAIYLIHILRGSRRQVRVPAIFLWADLPHAATGRTRRRWPPLGLLLILQLLAGALLAFGLARPASPGAPPQTLALILDASASMQATDVQPTRFEAARARALDHLNALRATDKVSLIRAGTDATLVVSGSPESVRSALGAVQPGRGSAAIAAALQLASAQIADEPAREGHILVLTDAAWPSPPLVGSLAAPVEVETVGGGADNQAITSLQVRLDPSGRAQTAFVEVANDADHAVRVPMRLSADGAPLDERQIDLNPRGRARLSIPLPLDARRVSVQLLSKDALALDDTADALAPGGPPRNVVVQGQISPGLRRALESIPFIHVVEPDSPAAATSDLSVLQGVLPAQLPDGPLLLVDPPSSSARLLGVGLGTAAQVHPDHPLLQGLDLTGFQTETPAVSSVPGWARVVLGTFQGPLVLEGRLEGRPVVALTFDPTISGIEKSLAFPLLISNASSYLLAEAETSSVSSPEPFDPAESDISPRPVPAFQTSPAAATTTGAPGAGSVDRWPWLLAAGLLVLGAEWVVFTKRG